MRFAAILGAFLVAGAVSSHAEAQWYKGVTHVHSLWSDGDMSPDLIADWYKDHGYHFMCFTDHNLLQEGDKYVSIVEDSKLSPARVQLIQERFGEEWVKIDEDQYGPRMKLKTHEELSAYFNDPEKFLLIPSEEITSIGSSPHVNAINLREAIRGKPGDKRYLLNYYIDAIDEQSAKHGVPMIHHVNHLNWSDGVTTEQMLEAKNLKYFEIYNGHPGVRQWGSESKGMPDNDRHWDVILSLRMAENPEFILYAFATDDSHEYYEWGMDSVNPGRGWVMVHADKLDADVLVNAMKAGDFYATTGVTLDSVSSDGKSLTVDIAEEEGVNYTTQFIGTRKGFDTTSKPAVNEAGETPEGSSLVYSDEIGVVLKETNDNVAVYAFAGDELYVRAKVISTKVQENPVRENDPQIAWVQPVRVAQ
jgi:hypothetical protein